MPTVTTTPRKTKSQKANGKKTITTSTSKKLAKLVYPEIKTCAYVGDKALTAEIAKKLFGWVEVTKSGFAWLFKDELGTKIACPRNNKNRPFYIQNARDLCQEILRGRWRINGEPIIIGQHGNILNGQHTLAALVLAAQKWQANPTAFPFWATEPVIEKIVTFGISEDDEVVNTLDTCKPRSLADVIYRSRLVEGKTIKDRKDIANKLSHSIRFVWDRIGMKDAFAISRTLTESIDFAYRHESLLKCAVFLQEEASTASMLPKCLSLGYLSGLMFLMATSNSDGEAYLENETPSDQELDFGLMDKAEEFMVLLSNNKLKVVVNSIAAIEEPSTMERVGVLAKAWNLWVDGGKITPNNLRLKYEEDDDGFKHLVDFPIVGGIDKGKPE